jgi:hypothetical protein
MLTETRKAGSIGKSALLVPLLLTATVYLSSAGLRAVIDYDEGHYSQVALQMIQRGDWVTPYNDGVRFLEKPPLMYWLTAASMQAFGINEFALRLPTALGVLALVWIVMRIARRSAGDLAAIIAGVCTAFSVGNYLFTREALHDIWLVLFIAVAMHAFLEWYRDARHPLHLALGFYAAMAGAVMTKSLVGVALPVGIVALFFLLMREFPDWRTLHLLPGSLLFLLLSVPWHWIAAVRNEGFLWSFFVNEQFLRFLGRHDPPVVWSVPLVTFWALNLIWFFPWTAFLPAVFIAGRKPCSGTQRVLIRLATAWAAVILGFFSISGRLEHYVFPALPALAILVGIALSRTDENAAVRWAFRGLAVLVAGVLVAGVGFGIWAMTAGHGFKNAAAERADMISGTDFSIMAEMPESIQKNLLKPAAATILALVVGFGAAAWSESRRLRLQAIWCATAVMVIICGMTQWSLVICEDMISSKKFALAVKKEAQPGDHMVVVGDLESANSIGFYQPLHVEIYDGVAYSLIPGMKYPDAPRIVLATEEFTTLWRGPERVFALLPKLRQKELRPGGTEMLQVLDRVLVRNR